MFIKTIVLDGFKSYAQRTEISGFDLNFNAITGLNGSGKSNILDSICFLLGITNLTQVRATNLQELIYKSGQAGVTKATVTITFDNGDKSQSPIGYESQDEITISRQIVLGGRNKYLINGSNANNTRVHDLFRSVQLNVNNPHFLIMQGRITKVLNMKPPEILAMIEEAAGTKMYDSKKQVAVKTMEKKETKLKEIQKILDEEITPTILKLKEERSSYLEYQKVIRELEHLTRLSVAFEFVKAQSTQDKAKDELDGMNANLTRIHERSAELKERLKAIEVEIKDLQRKKDAESGGALKEGEKKLDEMVKDDVKLSSDVKHAQELINAEKRKEKDLKKQLAEDENQLNEKEKTIANNRDMLSSLEKKSADDDADVVAAQNHFHAVSAGLSSNDEGEDKTLTDQLMVCKQKISLAETDIEQAKQKLKHCQSELKPKRAELKSTEKDYQKDSVALKALQKDIEKLQTKQEHLGYDEDAMTKLINDRTTVENDVSSLRRMVDSLESRFPQLEFSYKDPQPNFKHEKVKGPVCRLIKVKDIKNATSLEVTAGGKLFNVVIDTEQTGKALLQRGELKRRVTFIPLNKISARSLDQKIVSQAKALVGEDNAHSALSLVGYDKEIEAAMKFVFGVTLVSSDLDRAKSVAFKLNTKTVTLEGDVFDPAGTLSGGARKQGASILEQLDKLRATEDDLTDRLKQLKSIEKQISTMLNSASQSKEIGQQLDLKRSEIELVEKRICSTTHHSKLEEVKEMEQAITDQQTLISTSESIIKQQKKRVGELDDKMKEASSHRNKELAKAEGAINDCKKKADQSKKAYKLKEQEITGLKLETEELASEMQNLDEQMKATLENINKLSEDKQLLDEKSVESKKAIEVLENELKAQRDILKACSQEISKLNSEKGRCGKELAESDIKLKKIDHDIIKCNKESKDASSRVTQLLNNYEWIESEKHQFGVANTMYDFEASDPREVSKRLSKLQESRDKLSKNVNMRAMAMLGKAEEKCHDLLKKKKIVENDKRKIEEVIQELDDMKNDALKRAWAQVNEDFGSIFSTLLPGTNAKLSPPEGQSVLDGLEVKVAFGKVWKESLTELSGGQRSLVALSLILAMLRFKPAPIYILDEVDAALDLSHTQNIGQMLRAHFKRSQFIVVSLKDGMFNNASVLFKTKFVDGVSTVTRYVQNQTSKETRVLPSTAKKIRPAAAKRVRVAAEEVEA